MHSLGHGFMPPPIHAGGLRYHGIAPLMSQLIIEGLIEPRATTSWRPMRPGCCGRGPKGHPAPETNHAIAVAIEEAKKAKEEGKEKVIVMCFSGHGLLDLGGYDSYFNGRLSDYPLPEEELRKSLRPSKISPKPKMMRRAKQYKHEGKGGRRVVPEILELRVFGSLVNIPRPLQEHLIRILAYGIIR